MVCGTWWSERLAWLPVFSYLDLRVVTVLQVAIGAGLQIKVQAVIGFCGASIDLIGLNDRIFSALSLPCMRLISGCSTKSISIKLANESVWYFLRESILFKVFGSLLRYDWCCSFSRDWDTALRRHNLWAWWWKRWKMILDLLWFSVFRFVKGRRCFCALLNLQIVQIFPLSDNNVLRVILAKVSLRRLDKLIIVAHAWWDVFDCAVFSFCISILCKIIDFSNLGGR